MRRVGVLLLLLATVSCSGGGKATPTVDTSKPTSTVPTTAVATTTTAVTDAGSVARDFFQAEGSYDPDRQRKMFDLSSPGSPAYIYAKFQVATSEVAVQEGQQRRADDTMDITADAIKLCGSRSGPTGTDCATFTSFTADADTKKLTSFAVNGIRIDDRLVDGAGRASVQAGGASFTLTAAYEAVTTPSFSIVIEIKSGPAALNINVFRTQYVGADGRQVTASQSSGPTNLRASATAQFLLSFNGAKRGGRLYVSGSSSDFSQSFEAVIPV